MLVAELILIFVKHMSPRTMAALPKSPAGARRSSSGSGLRPVLPFGLDDATPVEVDEDEELLGPVPRDQLGPFAAGAGVDEVEYAYGQVNPIARIILSTDLHAVFKLLVLTLQRLTPLVEMPSLVPERRSLCRIQESLQQMHTAF